MMQIIAFRSFAMAPRKWSFAVIVRLYSFIQRLVVFASLVFAHCRPFMQRSYVVKEFSADR